MLKKQNSKSINKNVKTQTTINKF